MSEQPIQQQPPQQQPPQQYPTPQYAYGQYLPPQPQQYPQQIPTGQYPPQFSSHLLPHFLQFQHQLAEASQQYGATVNTLRSSAPSYSDGLRSSGYTDTGYNVPFYGQNPGSFPGTTPYAPPPFGYGTYVPPLQSVPNHYGLSASSPAQPSTIQADGQPYLYFFNQIKNKSSIPRDYILIIDKSGSMCGARWKEAQLAVKKIAPHACAADADGITLYFFSSDVKKYPGIKQLQQIEQLFKIVKPSGTTALHSVLESAFKEHFSTRSRATIILVITDGEPDKKQRVAEVIQEAANKVSTKEELSVSFIQIGNDRKASQFLQYLEKDVKYKINIVDTLSAETRSNVPFEKVIESSLATELTT